MQKKEPKKSTPRKPTEIFSFRTSPRLYAEKITVRTFRGHQPHGILIGCVENKFYFRLAINCLWDINNGEKGNMIDIRTYNENCKNQLSQLIGERKDSKNKNESLLHDFFEKYPFAILSALAIPAWYNVFSNVVISKPKLKSFNGDREPDFLVVTWNSLNLYFNFIELEDPSKKIFNSAKQKPSPEFFQAYNQLLQWKSFKTEVNDYCDELLRSLFKDNFGNTPDKVRNYNYILLYGFSEEIIQLGERHNLVLQSYFTGDLFHCTFSRLLKEYRLGRPMFSVKKDAATNKFKAVGFAPFKNYNIEQWSDFHNITNKEEIISKSEVLSKEEIENLIRQIVTLDKKSLKEIVEINLAQPKIRKSFYDPLNI